MRFRALLLVAGVQALVASGARAQSTGALAEELFRSGKQLLEERRFDEACPKFAEAARLDLSSGVELALGICLEGQGRIASAWGAYLSAASLARHDGRSDREQAAKARAAALEPRLSHLTIAVANETATLQGVEVREDGVLIGSPAWKDVPVDPGTHKLDVTAPGHKPFSKPFVVGAVSDSVTVHVPPLEPDVPISTLLSPTPPPTQPDHGGDWRRPTGFVVGGAGVVALGFATVFGLITLSDASAVRKVCPMSPCAAPGTLSQNNSALTLADWSTGLFVAGGVAVAAGALLVLTSPSHHEAPRAGAVVRPVVGPGYAGLDGAF